MADIREFTNIIISMAFVFLLLLSIVKAEEVADSTEMLISRAKHKWAPLAEAEEQLLRSVVDGELADLSDSSKERNEPNNSAQWDSGSRAIRGEFIAWLCSDEDTLSVVTYKGIRIKGARIDGELDVKFARIPFALSFEKCAFPLEITLEEAEILDLNFEGTHTSSINADGLRVDRNLRLHGGFKAEGEVRLIGAAIGGNLECSGSQFINKGARAISADGIKVSGGVFLYNGLKVDGETCLLGATIGHDLSCMDVEFINPNGRALNASGLKVEGYVFLRKGLKVDGELSLLCGTIGRDLSCIGSRCSNPHGYALNAGGLKVQGNVFFRDAFEADGKVSLACATIEKYLIWEDINCPDKILLDLRSAKIGTLLDEEKSWPNPNNLVLHGLLYNEIDSGAPRDAESRIKWLSNQPNFQPQSYEQLAAVLRRDGQDEDARKILIAKNQDRKKRTPLTMSEKFWYHILGPLIGYGYRPLNALWGALVFIILGWFLFAIGYSRDLITPQDKSAYVKRTVSTVVSRIDKLELTDLYPRFNSLIYSIDTFVPLIELYQAKYWLPNSFRGPRLLNSDVLTLHIGGLLRLYLWIHITMGWLFTTLLVIGLTGLIRT